MNDFLERIKAMFREFPITGYLIAINTLMLVLTMTLGGATLGGFGIDSLLRLGALSPALVFTNGEYYRILTAMFLHGSLLHFAFNMLALYSLGTTMEKTLGPIRYFLLYAFSGIGGGIAVVFLSPVFSVTIGASGALYGLMAAMLFITLRRKNWFTKESVKAIWKTMLINFAITFLVPSISIWGHVGGFVLGFLVCIFLMPKRPYFLEQRGFYGWGNDD